MQDADGDRPPDGEPEAAAGQKIVHHAARSRPLPEAPEQRRPAGEAIRAGRVRRWRAARHLRPRALSTRWRRRCPRAILSRTSIEASPRRTSPKSSGIRAESRNVPPHTILAALGRRKALVGNTGHRRHLRRTGKGKAFGTGAGKPAGEARFDGIFALRTNAWRTPLNAVFGYGELLPAEDLFGRAEAQLRTRPIHHSCDAAIRGHVFCPFPAPVLRKALADLRRSHEVGVGWGDPIRELARLREASIEKDGKRGTTRTPVSGQVGRVFQAAGVIC